MNRFAINRGASRDCGRNSSINRRRCRDVGDGDGGNLSINHFGKNNRRQVRPLKRLQKMNGLQRKSDKYKLLGFRKILKKNLRKSRY